MFEICPSVDVLAFDIPPITSSPYSTLRRVASSSPSFSGFKARKSLHFSKYRRGSLQSSLLPNGGNSSFTGLCTMNRTLPSLAKPTGALSGGEDVKTSEVTSFRIVDHNGCGRLCPCTVSGTRLLDGALWALDPEWMEEAACCFRKLTSPTTSLSWLEHSDSSLEQFFSCRVHRTVSYKAWLDVVQPQLNTLLSLLIELC